MMNIPTLDKAGLRKFGITTGIIVAVLFGLVLPWLFSFAWPRWPWILAAVLIFWAILHPVSLGPVYKGWMKFGLALGWINSRIILAILFYLIFMPLGMVMRTFGWDPMAKKTDKQSNTYRVVAKQDTEKHFEKPY